MHTCLSQSDLIDIALNEQAIRTDMASNICSRRTALRTSVQTIATMLKCSEKDYRSLEDGLLFPRMPALRIECFILLERMESRREGLRNSDLKTQGLRLVK
jgi:hypothetical protein